MRTVVTRILSFALRPKQGMTTIWLTGREKTAKPEPASLLSLSLSCKGSAKISLGIPALLIFGAILLSIVAAVVATLQPVYNATI